MKAVIIEDETTAVNSLKAILAQNTVTQIEVIRRVGEYRGERGFLPDIASSGYHLHGYPFSGRIGVKIFEQVEIDAPVVFTTALR